MQNKIACFKRKFYHVMILAWLSVCVHCSSPYWMCSFTFAFPKVLTQAPIWIEQQVALHPAKLVENVGG